MKGSYRNGGWQRFSAKEDYCCLLALSGEGKVGAGVIYAGEGVLLDLSKWSEEEIDLPREYLKLEFSERDALRVFGSHGIRADGEKFSLADLAELRRVAAGFFSVETEVSALQRRTALCELILSYVENEQKAGAEDSAASGYVRYVEEYVRDHLSESIQVDAIAEDLGISRGYLRNVFYSVHGMSPREYLTEARLKRAEELLCEGDRSVSAVAEEVGYTDVLQFSRIFKKHTGASPSQYRKDRGIAVEKVRAERVEKAPVKEEQPKVIAEPTPKKKAKDPVWLF